MRLRTLFEGLVKNPDRLPLRFRQRIRQFPVQKVVGEYIAGMTDAFCDSQCRQVSETAVGPLADW